MRFKAKKRPGRLIRPLDLFRRRGNTSVVDIMELKGATAAATWKERERRSRNCSYMTTSIYLSS
jgi:hypothetical protein